MLIKIKKLLLIFVIVVLAVTIGLNQKTSAATFNVGASCTYNTYVSGMSCDVFNDATLNTTNMASVVISSNNYDDDGGVIITGPSGAVQTHHAPGFAFANWPNGTNVTAWFNFDGVGTYAIRVFANDSAPNDMGGWINFTVTTNPTFCGDNIRQTPNEVGTGGPANDGNEQCDGTDNAVCGGLGCNSDCGCNGWIQYLWGGNYDFTDTCGGGVTTANCTTLNGITLGCPAGKEWSGCGTGPSACYVGFSPACSSPLRCANQFDACGCACIASTVCSETDGGIDYNVVGTTSGLNAAGNSIIKTDYCVGGALFEYYCDPAQDPARVYGKWKACPYGCSGGACSACIPSCPGGCADVGQSDGCSGTCPNNNGNPCNDGNACTVGDTCGGGSCSGTPKNCNDGNVCTTDSCNPASGCVYTNNTNPCNDGNVCTSGDVCNGGSCSGTPITCDDGDVCTTNSCDPASGCVYPVIPPNCALTADPSSIDIGDFSTLNWTTNCAGTASIDNGIGNVAPVNGGSEIVSPASATTYTMTVINTGGTDTCQTTVHVCGDGSISGPESCDTFGDIGCNDITTPKCDGCASCVSVCGDGVIGGSEFCDIGAGCGGLDPKCSNDCSFCTCSLADENLIFAGNFLGRRTPIICMVQNLILWILSIMGRIALLILIFGGVFYIVSGSNPEKQEKAKKTIVWALLGLALVLASHAIIVIMNKMFVQT